MEKIVAVIIGKFKDISYFISRRIEFKADKGSFLLLI